jgi:hypothetical protein
MHFSPLPSRNNTMRSAYLAAAIVVHNRFIGGSGCVPRVYRYTCSPSSSSSSSLSSSLLSSSVPSLPRPCILPPSPSPLLTQKIETIPPQHNNISSLECANVQRERAASYRRPPAFAPSRHPPPSNAIRSVASWRTSTGRRAAMPITTATMTVAAGGTIVAVRRGDRHRGNGGNNDSDDRDPMRR